MTLRHKDFEGLVKPTLYIDEFESKIASDDEIVVLSFIVLNAGLCNDMVEWFEKGYDFVMDADKSPGEVYPNKYLVYVEIKRRTQLIQQIKELLEDLETLTEFKLEEWEITSKGKSTFYDEKKLKKILDLSPHVYRINNEEELNEMRTMASIPIKSTLNKKDIDSDLEEMLVQAGII